MRRLLCIFISCFCLVFPLLAQSNRLIKELESKRGALQKQITESETLLKTTKKTVSSQLNGLAALTGQIEERKRYILTINKDVEAIDRELSSLERQLGQLQRDLKDKKRKYDSSVQYLYKNRSIEEKLMFIFSAQSLAQTYRRLRYVREYATYQRLQGEEILKKQEQVNKKKAELRQVRAAKADLLKERESEKMKLEKQGETYACHQLAEEAARFAKRDCQKTPRSQSAQCAHRPPHCRRDRESPQTCGGGSPSRSCRTQEGRCEDGQVGYGFRCIQNKGCSFGDLYHEQGRPRVVRRFCQ